MAFTRSCRGVAGCVVACCLAAAVAVSSAGPAAGESLTIGHSASPSTPATTTPSTSTHKSSAPSPKPTPSGSSKCGWFSVSCKVKQAINDWFKDLARSALNPVFSWVGRSLLSSPQSLDSGRVRGLWNGSLAIANTCFVLLILAGGLVLTGYQTLQTSYTVKDIAPRFVVGAVAANTSLMWIPKAIELANGLAQALMGKGVDPVRAARTLTGILSDRLVDGGALLVLIVLVAVMMGLILLLIYVVRIMLLVLLIGAAPLALAFHALPHTDGLAKFWWRAFVGDLAIQVAHALVLITAIRVFLNSNQSATFKDGTGGQLFNLLIVICLLYIMIRIPFWIFRPVFSSLGSSPLRKIGRYAVGAIVVSRAAGALSGVRAGGLRAPGARTRTTRTVSTNAKGASTVRVATVSTTRRQQRRRGVTHDHVTTERTNTTQKFPAPGKDGAVTPAKPPRTTRSSTTTHSFSSRKPPRRARRNPQEGDS